MNEIIDDVDNSKFTEFAKKVKTSLEDKLRNNSTIQTKAEEMNKFNSMEDTFKLIQTD